MSKIAQVTLSDCSIGQAPSNPTSEHKTYNGLHWVKGTGNTDENTLEIGDYLDGWEDGKYVAFRVLGLPYILDANRGYATNNEIL